MERASMSKLLGLMCKSRTCTNAMMVSVLPMIVNKEIKTNKTSALDIFKSKSIKIATFVLLHQNLKKYWQIVEYKFCVISAFYSQKQVQKVFAI